MHISKLIIFAALAAWPFASPAAEKKKPAPAAETSDGRLTLVDALARTLRRSPELAAFAYDERAAEARVLQAGIRPNPEASLVVEDIGATRGRGTIADSQATLELSQLIELGGKRIARIREAEAGRALVRYEYEAKRLEVLRTVATDFVAVLGAQRRVELQREIVTLAESLGPEIENRFKIGKASVAEQTRNEVAAATARIGLATAVRELANARRQLAGRWGAKGADFDSVSGNLESHPAPAAPGEYLGRLDAHPSVARWDAETAKRRATVVKERANGTGDVTVGLGTRWLNGPDAAAFVGSVSIPLPLRNKNEGTIREAQALEAKAAVERKAAELTLGAGIREAYGKLVLAQITAQMLDDTVLPGAQRTVDAVNAGFATGKFSYLEVLEARRTLNDARTQHLTALVEYHKTAVELDALTGGHGRLRTTAAPARAVKKK